MKTRLFLRAGLTGLTLMLAAIGLPALAQDASPDQKTAAAYPLDTCVVSGDKLEGGDMGAPIDYVYKEAGKPDRLVRFCCKGCIKDFKKDPAQYLQKIDEAAAAKAHAGHAGPGT